MMDIPHPMYVTMESAWELELACTNMINTYSTVAYYCCTLPQKSFKYLYNKSWLGSWPNQFNIAFSQVANTGHLKSF